MKRLEVTIEKDWEGLRVEQVLRRRIKNTLNCQCEVWLRVE